MSCDSKGQQHGAHPVAAGSSTGDVDISTEQVSKDGLERAEVVGDAAMQHALCGAQCRGATEAAVLHSRTGHRSIAGPVQALSSAGTPRTLPPVYHTVRSCQSWRVAVVGCAAELTPSFSDKPLVYGPLGFRAEQRGAGEQSGAVFIHCHTRERARVPQ